MAVNCFSLLKLWEGIMFSESKELMSKSTFDEKELKYTVKSCGKLQWRLEDYLVIRLNVKCIKRVPVKIAFMKGNAEGVSVLYFILPVHDVAVTIPLNIVLSQSWFLCPYPGCLKATVSGKPCLLEDIDGVEISFPHINNGSAKLTREDISLYSVSLEAQPDFSGVGGRMVCDRYGQRRDETWQGKIYSDEQLEKELRSAMVNIPNRADIDSYGGWKGKQFEKKGYFYITSDERRLWICDPEGNAFLAIGFGYGSGGRIGSASFVQGYEKLYEHIPDKNGEYSQAFSYPSGNAEFVKRYGTDGNKNRLMFNFTKANMIRVFGKDKWLDAWCAIYRSRLKKWGMNSVDIGIDDENEEPSYRYAKRLGVPFIYRMEKYPTTKRMIFRDFCDVCSEEFSENAKTFARQLKPFLDDKNFIGFYMNNEPFFMTAPYSITEAALNDGAKTRTREYILEALRKKYRTILCLNEVWNTDFCDFEFINTRGIERSAALEYDLYKLDKCLTEMFWKIPADECRRITDGKCINIGFRPAGSWTKNYDFGMDSTDVFSMNCYKTSPKEELFNLELNHPSKPIMLSEWHIGSVGNRLYQNGLVATPDDSVRAKACRKYFEDGFAATNCVGVHYFEYCDMPLLGRFDGACAAIGFVDGTGVEYKTLCDECACGCRNAYLIADGRMKPIDFPDDWEKFEG